MKTICRLLLSLALIGAAAFAQPARPRVVITTDPELDDSNSLVRFLLYSTDVRVEGLVYASSQFHWKGDGKGTKWFVAGRQYTRYGLNLCPCTSWRWAPGERYIDDAVETYEEVYANLKVHNSSYPTPAELKSKIRVGNVEFDGDISKDSPGSDLIKSLILDDKGGPLFLAAWGGHSTIARALKSIQDQYEKTPQWPAIKAKVSAKVVLLPSGDQDNMYAKYINPNWPEIDYRMQSGGPWFGYGAQRSASPENAPYYTAAWMKENVSSRGPLGGFYRVWGDGKQMVKDDIFDYFGFSGLTADELKAKGYIVWMPIQEKGSWLGEGDTGTFMNLLDNGLRAYEDSSFGGWGGRKRPGAAAGFGDFNAALTALKANVANRGGAAPPDAAARGRGGAAAAGPAEPNFLPAAQRDFAARLKWSVTPRFVDANHEPVIKIKGPLNLTAHPGETIRLAGEVSDPDRDAVTVKWWQYRAGSYPGEVAVANPSSATTDFRVPADATAGQTIHLILEATDNGTPALTRYQRVIVTVQGK